MIFIKSMVVWLIFILAESLNGAVRMVWLVPSLGDRTAHQISFFTGSIVVLAIATLFIRWLQVTRVSQLLRIGVLWVVLTVGFEMILGRVILGYSWTQIAADYNVLNGGLMPLGLVWLMLSPWIATTIREAIDQTFQTSSKQTH